MTASTFLFTIAAVAAFASQVPVLLAFPGRKNQPTPFEEACLLVVLVTLPAAVVAGVWGS